MPSRFVAVPALWFLLLTLVLPLPRLRSSAPFLIAQLGRLFTGLEPLRRLGCILDGEAFRFIDLIGGTNGGNSGFAGFITEGRVSSVIFVAVPGGAGFGLDDFLSLGSPWGWCRNRVRVCILQWACWPWE